MRTASANGSGSSSRSPPASWRSCWPSPPSKGDETALEATVADTRVNELWPQYQAKRVRQQSQEIAVGAMERELLALGPAAAPALRARFEADIQRAKDDVARLADEPDPKYPTDPTKGDGLKQIETRAHHYEHERDLGLGKIPNFHYAETLLQIATVLCTVAMVGASRRLLALALLGGAVAVVLLLNGFIFLVPIAGGH